MKRILTFLVVGFSSQLAFSALLETTSEAERIIDQRYTTERSHRMALKRLDALLEDTSLTDAVKESRIRAEFLSSSKLTSENAGELLLYTPILSWRVHSLTVAYDLEGRYETIVSRDRLSEAKTVQTVGTNEEKTRSENRTSTGEVNGSLRAEAGLVFGIIPKLTVDADARTLKTASNTSSKGNQSAWSRQDQASLNARYESVMKELSETKLSGLHIRFVVEFSNNTEKDMIVPAESVIPVYADSVSFSVMAKMESTVPLNIPAHGTVDISFRGDLATTAARELIDFMRTKSPVISPERSPLLIIRSTDGAIRNAVNEAMRVACARVVCGDYIWNVRKIWDDKPITIQQAFEAVNSRYNTAPFVWDGLKLKMLCDAAVEPFELGKIPCVETEAGISIGWDDVSSPLTVDEIRFGLMNAEAFIIGKGRRWDDLTKKSQDRLIARLRDLKDDAAAWYLLGVCYEYGLGVGQSAEKAAECYCESAKAGDSRGQYEYGQCFYSGWGGVEQSYAEAMKWYRKSTEQRNTVAEYSLGHCYYYGKGIDQSYVEAVKWYRAAAEQGYASAQNGLGVCYEYGLGIEQSYVEAVKWYRAAAEQGDAIAQRNLGECYDDGKGVKQSYAEAVKWYHAAAEQGNAVAQNNLGVCYYYGMGIDQSYAEAVKWYRAAAEQGDATAQRNLGVCYNNGQGVGQSYAEAVKWYRAAAEQGDATAQRNLGVCCDNGQGVEQSYAEAVRWYRAAAEQGDAIAQRTLGISYEYGQGIEQSYFEAAKWYRKAAEQGDAIAQFNLGVCYEYGHGIEQSYIEAVKWYRASAEQGIADAQCNLGMCYWKGHGVAPSYSEAAKWCRKSAEQGNANAQYNLGVCYDNGQGVKQSYAEAVKWYRAAAEQGHNGAQYNLGISYANGSGCKKSVKLAMYWFRKAKENGKELDKSILEYMKAHKDE